ncbi:MAG TPA: D-aminoacyl-tRNA deacylase [Geobacterales bacterium]|nr:D-aminoacyl-tRNA deacylase [Geobacterales bacterium]
MKKIAFITSEKDPASINMKNRLLEKTGFQNKEENPNFELYTLSSDLFLLNLKKTELIFADFVEKLVDADFFIFLSKHVSKNKIDGVYVHSIGNFSPDNSYGGKPNSICYTSSFLIKRLFLELNEGIEDTSLVIGMEATHHGPYIEKVPCVFLEIGSSEERWRDEKLAETVIELTLKALKNDKKFSSVIAIGGSHYAPAFIKIQAASEYAIGHIIPAYAIEHPNFEKRLVAESVKKTLEGATAALIDWKGLRSAERDVILRELEKINVPVVKIK